MPAPGSFIGNTLGEAAAFAAGIAIAPLLQPLVKALENETWSTYPDVPLNAQTVAQGVAEGKPGLGNAAEEAALTGMSQNRFDLLVELLQKSPGVAEGLVLLRRQQIDVTGFQTILARAGLEAAWVAAYQATGLNGLAFDKQPIPPPDIALGMVRNNLPNTDNAGNQIFPPGLDSSGSTVPQAPMPNIKVEDEAAMSGYDLERFTVLANNVGLPPGIVEGLQMLRRNIITPEDFALLVEQSDLRIAWGPFIIQLQNQVLTAHEAAELYIRGWINQQGMYYLGSLTGYSSGDMDLLSDMIGRPPSLHAITTGLERGGVWDGTPQLNIPEPYLKMFQESSLRPEWYSIEYSNRFTYPSYFVLKAITASGAITVSQATTYLLYQGWEPTLAALTAESFAPTAATGGKKLTVAQIRAAWKAGSVDTAAALTMIEADGYSAANAQLIVDGWSGPASTAPVVAPPGGG